MSVIFKTYSECVDRSIHVARHESDVSRGVDAAGQEDAKWHIGHHAFFDGVCESILNAFDIELLTRGPIKTINLFAWDAVAGYSVPIARGTKLSGFTNLQIMTGWQLEHALEHGEGRRRGEK
jgi:hypothetical protein